MTITDSIETRDVVVDSSTPPPTMIAGWSCSADAFCVHTNTSNKFAEELRDTDSREQTAGRGQSDAAVGNQLVRNCKRRLSMEKIDTKKLEVQRTKNIAQEERPRKYGKALSLPLFDTSRS